MVYGIEVIKDVRYHTYLKTYLKALNGEHRKYNWLITNYECYPSNSDIKNMLSQSYCFISGDELEKMSETEDFQWIWGTFSAFEKNVQKEEILKYKLPWNDDYNGYWKSPLKMQHPLSQIQIVAEDSTSTTFLSKNKNIIDLIKTAFPFSVDIS